MRGSFLRRKIGGANRTRQHGRIPDSESTSTNHSVAHSTSQLPTTCPLKEPSADAARNTNKSSQAVASQSYSSINGTFGLPDFGSKCPGTNTRADKTRQHGRITNEHSRHTRISNADTTTYEPAFRGAAYQSNGSAISTGRTHHGECLAHNRQAVIVVCRMPTSHKARKPHTKASHVSSNFRPKPNTVLCANAITDHAAVSANLGHGRPSSKPFSRSCEGGVDRPNRVYDIRPDQDTVVEAGARHHAITAPNESSEYGGHRQSDVRARSVSDCDSDRIRRSSIFGTHTLGDYEAQFESNRGPESVAGSTANRVSQLQRWEL